MSEIERKLLESINEYPDCCTIEYAERIGESCGDTTIAILFAEHRGLVERRVVCKKVILWSLTGKQRCSVCDEFLEYNGIVWACTTCEKNKFECCFGEFDSDSSKCKSCAVAVECYEAST